MRRRITWPLTDFGTCVLIVALMFLVCCLALAMPESKAPLTRGDHAIIMSIADGLLIPRSVADRLQIEESGDPKTGAWGDANKIGPVGADGERCLGLYQLNPKIIPWALSMFYPHDPKLFDWRDPIDNAVVALGLMRWLHENLNTWFASACGFNAGIGKVWRGDITDKTRAYAMRVIQWPGTPEEPEPSFDCYPEAFRAAAAWEWRQQPGGPGRNTNGIDAAYVAKVRAWL